LDAEDTLRMVGAAFGIPVRDIAKSDLIMSIEAFLVTQISQGKRCLLVVDEAQNLTQRAVEELRMLSNFQFGKQALLQTFLVGQPEFREILQSHNMRQLRQRVTATCHIGPMDVEETRGYIEHRLHCVGSTGRPAFDPGAISAIHTASGGIPRRINTICDRLLLLGFLSEKDRFESTDVDEVVNEIREESGGASLYPSQPAAGTGGESPSGYDIDLSSIELNSEAISGFGQRLEGLRGEGIGERLTRLERSMTRLEKVNLEILGMLQQVFAASSRGRRSSQPESAKAFE
jgi:hypothetical protein